MDDTIRLQLPYIMPAQAQKHVTHNEALRRLDALVQACVLDRDRTEPPSAPAEGDCHIVADGATGAWHGAARHLAAWQDGAWTLFRPSEGWRAWSLADAALLVFRQGEWRVLSSNPAERDRIGINATADAFNRLVLASPAALFTHEGGGHQLKINKAGAGDSASLLFQTGFAGRAELGTTGDEDFRLKVSPDGATWREAIVVDRTTGAVALPNTPVRASRERLTADRIYYVRTDGSDANDGLSDTAGGAFASVQHALDIVYGRVDLAAHHVTIQLGAGTFAENLTIAGSHVGLGGVMLQGTGAGTAIAGGSAGSPTPVLQVTNGARLSVARMEIRSTTLGVHVDGNAIVTLRTGLSFGGAKEPGLFNIQASGGGSVICEGAHALLADAGGHIRATLGGQVRCSAAVAADTVAFSTAFVQADRTGVADFSGSTFSGTSTGRRYDVSANAVVVTGASDPETLPGSLAGTLATGGQYI